MRELELLLKLADATEVEFFRGLLRDLRARFGDKETLDSLDDICAKLSGTNSTSVKELIQETQQLRDDTLIRVEFEKWNEAQRQQREQEQKYPNISTSTKFIIGNDIKKGWEW